MARKQNPTNSPTVFEGAMGTAPVRAHRLARSKHTRLTPEIAASSPEIVDEHEAIARLAYSYWEARGYQGGDPEQDWLRAEAEYRACHDA